MSINIKNYEKFHCSIGFIWQAYHFFISCLPSKDDNFPIEINGVYFEDIEHVRIYENELSYSFLLRVFGTLEELCNNLGLDDKKISKIIQKSKNISDDHKESYIHIRKLRHVISHGNGVGKIIRCKYTNYPKDHNDDLLINLKDHENFVKIITSVAKELSNYASKAT